jgi:hypothetical protein
MAFFAEQVPVSAYVGSSKNLKDLKDTSTLRLSTRAHFSRPGDLQSPACRDVLAGHVTAAAEAAHGEKKRHILVMAKHLCSKFPWYLIVHKRARQDAQRAWRALLGSVVVLLID